MPPSSGNGWSIEGLIWARDGMIYMINHRDRDMRFVAARPSTQKDGITYEELICNTGAMLENPIDGSIAIVFLSCEKR